MHAYYLINFEMVDIIIIIILTLVLAVPQNPRDLEQL